MNKTNFNQTGGYPLKTERLQEQQKAYEIFNLFGFLAGDLTIISGCETTGSTVGNGSVFINGEILEFREASGDANSNVVIIEEAVNRSFENGVVKPVYFVRYATFGTAETSWPWASFTKPVATKNIAGILSRLTAVETKLNGIEAGAQKNVNADWNVTNPAAPGFIKNKKNFLTALYQGTVDIGNLTSNSYSKLVSFPDIGTSSYQVVVSIKSKSGDFNQDNNVFENTREHTSTSFKLCMREMQGIDQNISINYFIIPV